ncbi:competence/damage-inducible protein A [Candidatus Ruminimicrobium bovinum]|uniref:competence/damage-inducible protein A n=1 Tax=Candidatus Ruminimicrobium bovinum TaxID=3242779 RepID=UPI0039B9BE28
MKVELICSGSELLTGKLNTHACFIGAKLSDLGLNLSLITTVSDRKKEFKEVLEQAVKRSSVIIVTGGLGPTFDDITVETVSEILKLKTYKDENVQKAIVQYFQRRGITNPASNNERQSYILEGAKVLENRFGTAPGQMLHFQYIENENKKVRKTIFLLPGPPRELQPMFEENVIPFMKSYQIKIKKTLTLHICGMAESLVDEKIKPVINYLSNNDDIEFAILAHKFLIDVKVSVSGENELTIDDTLKNINQEFINVLGDNIYGYNEDTLESVIQKMLIEKRKTISVAESCTGGMIASKLTNTAGSSVCFKQSVVTYSNQAKNQLLNVKSETLQQFGAVSEETANEMLDGILNLSKADYAISVTGIAGPGGATKDKPVGLVYIGVSYRGKNKVEKFIFNGTREDVRERATTVALDTVRRLIKITK